MLSVSKVYWLTLQSIYAFQETIPHRGELSLMLVIFSALDVPSYAYRAEENAIVHHSRKSTGCLIVDCCNWKEAQERMIS